MATRECPSCGKILETDYVFCPACGAAMHKEEVVQTERNNYSNKNNKYIRAEQLYRIGETENAMNLFVEYTDEYPLDWEAQIRVADICEELMQKYGPEELKLQKYNKAARVLDFFTQLGDGTGTYVDTVGKFTIGDGTFAYCVALRERMLKLAQINAPENMKTVIDKRLNNVELSPEFGVRSKDAVIAETVQTDTASSPNTSSGKKGLGIALIVIGAIIVIVGLSIGVWLIPFIGGGIAGVGIAVLPKNK